MARMGLCLLQGGKFAGRQVIPADWVREMSARQVDSAPAGLTSIRGGFRADGAAGQYILVLPDQDAVIVTTAQYDNMPEELYLIWKHILPAL